MAPVLTLALLPLLDSGAASDPVPAPEDVKAGWTALLIFVGLGLAVVFLAFSLVKQLRKAQAARDAGVYGDPPVAPDEEATGETTSESRNGRGGRYSAASRRWASVNSLASGRGRGGHARRAGLPVAGHAGRGGGHGLLDLAAAVGHRVPGADADAHPDLDGVLVRAEVEELPLVVAGLLLDELLDLRVAPLAAGVLQAVGHDADDHGAGAPVLGHGGEPLAGVGDEPATESSRAVVPRGCRTSDGTSAMGRSAYTSS